MPATATKPTIGTLTSHLPDRSRVKFMKGDVLHYGVVRIIFSEDVTTQADKLVLKYAKQGMLLVDDAVKPVAHVVAEADVTDVPFNHRVGEDEYETFVEQAYYHAKRKADRLPEGIVVGKLFSIGVNDGQASYVITKVSAKTCDVEWRGFGGGDRYTDHYFGWGRKGVKHDDVEPYIRRSDGFGKMAAEQEQARKAADKRFNVGMIVHVHNSHGRFIRCEVVLADENPVLAARMGREPMLKQKMLKPIALVGKWNTNDLPLYSIDGTVRRCYHAEQIAKGETNGLNMSTIFESPSFAETPFVKGMDPATLPPLPLNPPEPTPEQAAQFKAYKLLGVLSKLTTGIPGGLDYNDPVAMLADAERRLAEVATLVASYRSQVEADAERKARAEAEAKGLCGECKGTKRVPCNGGTMNCPYCGMTGRKRS